MSKIKNILVICCTMIFSLMLVPLVSSVKVLSTCLDRARVSPVFISSPVYILGEGLVHVRGQHK